MRALIRVPEALLIGLLLGAASACQPEAPEAPSAAPTRTPAAAAAKPLPGQGDDVGKTVIYRDTWGVPH
ncbi:MAG: hypothetical protein ACKOZX_00895, partial [Gammaproteobacteria bacterium]